MKPITLTYTVVEVGEITVNVPNNALNPELEARRRAIRKHKRLRSAQLEMKYEQKEGKHDNADTASAH